jgi:hypothetical protein
VIKAPRAWLVIVALLAAASVLHGQTWGAIRPLESVHVKTDANGALLVYGLQGATPYSPVGTLSTRMGKSEANGGLAVAMIGGVATPDTICLDATNQDACLVRSATNTIKFATTSAGSTAAPITFSTATAGTSVISPLFRSDSAKVLVIGTGTGATQFSATQTTPPTCSSNCGTSPSVVGTDTAGIVTMGASGVPASGWVVTFNGTWAAAPACIVVSALVGMAAGKAPIVVATTPTTITVTTNGTAPATSDKYAYQCVGTQ